MLKEICYNRKKYFGEELIMTVHSDLNLYLVQKKRLMKLLRHIKESENASLLQSYNSALYSIEDRDRFFTPSYTELHNQFRLTEEQINFIRK